MRIEFKSGVLRLARNQTLHVRDGTGSTVCALEGAVWITEENQPRDVVLEAGKCYRLRQAGLALVHALGGEAAVNFT